MIGVLRPDVAVFLVREIEQVTEKVTFRQRFKGDGRATHENTRAEGTESSKDPGAGSEPAGCGAWWPGWGEG